MMPSKKPLTILLASPRGFCAGVDRAIQIVERALERYGRPVYVRHEIVHNRYVVENLEAKGAVFVDELDEVPDDRPVVFSAHGVPKAVPAEAGRRKLLFVDATCPLVSKVHREAERHHEAGRRVVLIGHAGHPEVIGTMGQLPPGAVLLVENVAQAAALDVPDPQNLGLALDVNGTRRQTGNTSTMIFDVWFVVHYLSQFLTLEAGDVVITGTPPGVGMGCKPPEYLKAGDIVALSIDGLGSQRSVCEKA